MLSSTWLARAALAACALVLPTADAEAQSLATHPRVKEAVAAYEKWLDGQPRRA